ncbi:hypothetical protein [Bacillus sp. JCM 19034]|uniref:hypothetical protein n=1 Tax=Bacillus sp. JCM 19034 TaxID=1481928 RepID=UPI0007852BF4|nr:hypothetical protein [Bacillus sp. JCM 19034]
MSDPLVKKLNQLKKQYDDMPTQTSVERIMTRIKVEEKGNRRYFFPKNLRIVALLMIMVGIGYILGMNQLAKDEELTAFEEMAEEMYIHESSDAAKSGSEESEEMALGDEDNIMFEIAINNAKEEVINVLDEEGMETEKTVKRLDAGIFSTLYDSNFHYVKKQSLDITRHQVYSHLTGENEEPIVFELSYFHNGAYADSLGDYIENYERILENEGFSQFEETNNLTEKDLNLNADMIYEFKAKDEPFQTFVAVLKFNGEYYFLRTSEYEL